MSNRKPDSAFLLIVYLLFMFACIIGATGCIFDDVAEERGAAVACAVIGTLIVAYILKCMFTLAQDLDTRKPIDRSDASLLDLP